MERVSPAPFFCSLYFSLDDDKMEVKKNIKAPQERNYLRKCKRN